MEDLHHVLHPTHCPEQDLLSLTDAEGDLLIFSDGIAADFSGKLDINVPDASAIGKYSLLLNTTGNIVNQSFVVAGDTRVLKVDAGPFIRIVGQGVILEIDGQNLEGNFGFEQNSAGEVFAQLTEVRAAFSEGGTDVMVFENGNGVLLLTSAGVAVDLAGDLNINLPDVVSAGASFRFIINTTSDAVDRTINLTGTEQTISVDTGSLIRIVGRGVKLEVLNNDVSGDFGFQQEAGGQIIGQIDNGRFAFHDGSRDLLVLDNGVGALVATTAMVKMGISSTVAAAAPAAASVSEE